MGRKIRSVVKVRSLQFECAGVPREGLLVPVLIYGSKAMVSKEKEISRNRA